MATVGKKSDTAHSISPEVLLQEIPKRGLKWYLDALEEALNRELEKQMEQYQREILTWKPERRETAGRCVRPVKVGGSGKNLPGGDIEFFFPRVQTVSGAGGYPDMQPGDVVLILPDDSYQRKEDLRKGVEGTLSYVSRSGVGVRFSAKEVSEVYSRLWEWKKRKALLRIDLYASRIPHDRCVDALWKWRRDRSRLSFLQELLNPEEQLTQVTPLVPREEDLSWFDPALNNSQKQAIRDALSATVPFWLIHGPPGTGKTTTLIELILQVWKRGKRILVCADSNVAVDNVVDRLVKMVRKHGLKAKIVRVGNVGRIHPDVQEVSLEKWMESHEDFPQLQELLKAREQIVEARDEIPRPGPQVFRGMTCEEILELAREIQQGNRLSPAKTRGLRPKQILEAARWCKKQVELMEVSQEIQTLRERIIHEILSKAEIVCTTNIGAGLPEIQRQEFDLVVLDEATQATPPAQLIPMLRSRRYVMAGDPKQLPPVVMDPDRDRILSVTLFELLQARCPSCIRMLEVQYRMHRHLMEIPSRMFYGGKLKADDSVAGRTLQDIPGYQFISTGNRWMDLVVSPQPVFVWFHLPGAQEQRRPGNPSLYNWTEAQFLVKMVQLLRKRGLPARDLGVITPYEEQKLLLRRLLARQGMQDIEVHTVDGFQGREKEVILISLVRANPSHQIGFLADARRLNVAITRARVKLIVLGDRKTFQESLLYRRWIKEIQHVLGQNVFVTASLDWLKDSRGEKKMRPSGKP